MRCIHICGLCALLASMPGAAAKLDAARRFELRADIPAQSTSEDDRFVIVAELRVLPENTSADGRFAMKSVMVPEVGCDAFLDLFANGFEGSQ